MFSPVIPQTQPTQQRVQKVPEIAPDPFVTQSAQSLIAGSQMQPLMPEDYDETMFEPEDSSANRKTKTVGQLQSGLDADNGNFSMKDLERATNHISQSSKKRKAAASTSKSSVVTKPKRVRGAKNAKRFSI